ncbi:erythropoietin receptor precursor [Xenopus laevis]|uniref:Erythropoietin receptor n=2 Tax=Xenopus laevis TaxID=8355 RepID=EPOR_XENLA|nr:erythropoietin receptor precursor [Xenopus laevis]Q4W815.1 RecName: Full=Erythropoietin receptor; Short=EPO-R; Short=EpoR; Short=xlEPOR; Flags: Precursor [Xenopus laevis]BAD98623.1 erythropoietin receptor homologue [Xenopus laevis]
MGAPSSLLFSTAHWRTVPFLLAFWVLLSTGTAEDPTMTPEFLRHISEKIPEEYQNPHCFTRDLNDFICFWEGERRKNASFSYSEDDQIKWCQLRTEVASNNTWWYICEFPVTDVVLFAGITISAYPCHKCQTAREIYINELVLLNPPLNVTVKEKQDPRGLLISWKPPHFQKNHDINNEIKYQVNYSTPGADMQTVEVEAGNTEIFLTDIVPAAYTVTVRCKADGVSYNGYWSDWTAPITIATIIDLRLLLLLSIAIFVALIAGVGVYIFMRHGMYLKHKVWPQVPTPENNFQGLFTTHKGNFKLWLGQADAYLLWISRHVFQEDPSSTLEVLSELPPAALPQSFNPNPLKDSYVVLDENRMPCSLEWLEAQRHKTVIVGAESMDSRLQTVNKDVVLEDTSKGQIAVKANNRVHSLEGDGSQGEAFREDEYVEAPRMEHERHRVSRENSVSSDGKQSIPSSFEYTELQTCEGLLSPKPRPVPPRMPLKYAYLDMSSSGEHSPPPSPNFYQNSPITNFLAPIYSQS